MRTSTAPEHRPPPALAVAAAVLGVLGAAVPGLLALVLLALSSGHAGVRELLWPVALAGLAVALVVGAALLLLGRSWLALVVPAAAVVVLVVVVRLSGGGATGIRGVVALLFPLAAAVLAALPGVRRWVRDRRAAAAVADPRAR